MEVLNKCDGFGGLVNTFSERLALPPGPDAEQANFVLVLDQFEELFHWSNKDVPECGTLVQRVLDHFYSPHPRVYVVITMRSEHLNDCAAFLRLPDAINKASYLVRRLDPAEIDETIERPPSRYLRMLARASGGKHKVPARFRFEQSVLSRIQHDVEAIHADPDHLALLQHLLARLWDAACFRVLEDGADVPGGATWNDLERAVSARTDGNARPYPTRRTCCGCVWRTGHNRFSIASGLTTGSGSTHCCDGSRSRTRTRGCIRNSASYSMRPWALIDGADPRLLLAGFLPPCDYLLWMTRIPIRSRSRSSTKRSIRGWRHFQLLIDREAELFEEFLALLRPAQTWLESNAAGRRPLLDGEHLARVRESRLKDVLHDARPRRKTVPAPSAETKLRVSASERRRADPLHRCIDRCRRSAHRTRAGRGTANERARKTTARTGAHDRGKRGEAPSSARLSSRGIWRRGCRYCGRHVPRRTEGECAQGGRAGQRENRKVGRPPGETEC